jgi:hypothetical protein
MDQNQTEGRWVANYDLLFALAHDRSTEAELLMTECLNYEQTLRSIQSKARQVQENADHTLLQVAYLTGDFSDGSSSWMDLNTLKATARGEWKQIKTLLHLVNKRVEQELKMTDLFTWMVIK